MRLDYVPDATYFVSDQTGVVHIRTLLGGRTLEGTHKIYIVPRDDAEASRLRATYPAVLRHAIIRDQRNEPFYIITNARVVGYLKMDRRLGPDYSPRVAIAVDAITCSAFLLRIRGAC